MKNLEIRRRLIRSMRNRISYSVAVAVTPETFQNDVFFQFSKNHRIRRRLIRSMRNRISYSVTVAVTPETFQNDVFFHFFIFSKLCVFSSPSLLSATAGLMVSRKQTFRIAGMLQTRNDPTTDKSQIN